MAYSEDPPSTPIFDEIIVATDYDPRALEQDSSESPDMSPEPKAALSEVASADTPSVESSAQEAQVVEHTAPEVPTRKESDAKTGAQDNNGTPAAVAVDVSGGSDVSRGASQPETAVAAPDTIGQALESGSIRQDTIVESNQAKIASPAPAQPAEATTLVEQSSDRDGSIHQEPPPNGPAKDDGGDIAVLDAAPGQTDVSNELSQVAHPTTNGGPIATPDSLVSPAITIDDGLSTATGITVPEASTPTQTQLQRPGRGRGRGRGRGSRSSLVNGTAHASTPSTPNGNPNDTQATPTSTGGRGSARGRGRGRGSRGGRGGRGGRRKRNEDEIRAGDSPSETDSDDLVSSDDETVPTKFGRPVQKPTSFAPGTSSQLTGLKRKRTTPHHARTRNPEFSVCIVCSRPHSPATNMIVFCDGCNTPYHRYCHRPSIAQLVVDVPDKEWFCAECEADHVLHYDVATFRPAERITDEKLRTQLTRLPSSVLVNLLIQARQSHPEIALIPPPRGSVPPPVKQPTPPPPEIKRIPPKEGELVRPPDDELESGYESDPPARPKAGDGLAATLPPEKDHEAFLVDDNAEVYTHLWQVDPKAANEGLHGTPTPTPAVEQADKMDVDARAETVTAEADTVAGDVSAVEEVQKGDTDMTEAQESEVAPAAADAAPAEEETQHTPKDTVVQ